MALPPSITPAFAKIAVEEFHPAPTQQHSHAKPKESLDNHTGYGPEYDIYRKQMLEESGKISRRLNLPPEKMPLWYVLDTGKIPCHRNAIANEFLKSISGKHPELSFCETAYYRYLLNLIAIHHALEDVQNEIVSKVPHLAGFVTPELYRTKGILEDIAAWGVFADMKKVTSDAVSEELPNHIRKVVKGDPELAIAIMYVLYGTLMAGGQTNREKVQNKLNEGLRGIFSKDRESLEKSLLESKDEKDKATTIIELEASKKSGIGLFEIVRNGENLTGSKLAEFKLDWHTRLSEVELKLPPGTDLSVFHHKLIREMDNVFTFLLKTIKVHVQEQKC